MQTLTNNGTKVRYTVQRNMKAQDKDRKPCLIAIAFCELENGHKFTCAINEGLISYAGEGIIDDEVKQRAVREIAG